MPDIKTKPKNELKIKKFDGSTIYKQKSVLKKKNNIQFAQNRINKKAENKNYRKGMLSLLGRLAS